MLFILYNTVGCVGWRDSGEKGSLYDEKKAKITITQKFVTSKYYQQGK